MNVISLAILTAAVSLEFFSIAQRYAYFLANNYFQKITLYFVIHLAIITVFLFFGSMVNYLLVKVFVINSFWLFILVLCLLSFKYMLENFSKIHVKKTINPIFTRNLIGLFMALGINIFIMSIALSGQFVFNQIIVFVFLFSLLFSLIGFFVGSITNKLINLRLELFSALLIIGVLLKKLIDYYLIT